MGTNYYYKNNNNENIHIGKNSIGRKFNLAFNSFKNHIYWKRELKNKTIYDQYGKILTYNELITIIESKQYIINLELTEKEKLINKFPTLKLLNINGYMFVRGKWS